MATLTIIGEPFPDWEAEAHAAAAIELTEAVAATAPRGCSARLLLSRGSDQIPSFSSPRAQVETLPLKTGMLPVLWQSSTTARPLDGEFVHSLTPMVPLRSRGEDDGSQTSVTVPHGIAWEVPELMGGSSARLYRSFVKRAVRMADVVVTPTHATANVLQRRFGEQLPVQVLPLAAPEPYRRPADAAERRSALGVPERYMVTTAAPGQHGRLDWVLDALAAPGAERLPHLVVLAGCFPWPEESAAAKGEAPRSPIPSELQGRVTIVRPRELADLGAVFSGAELMVLPQTGVGTGYCVLGALSSAVPVLHAGSSVCAELTLDAGVAAETREAFAAELARLFGEPEALTRLRVLADDRGRAFSWESTAWQLWELHANL